ncbi:MAG: flagellar protein FliT [Nitrospirota bacterium]
MSIKLLIHKKTEHLRSIGDISRKMRAEWTKEDLKILLVLGDQRDMHINEIMEIERSILLLAVDGYDLSDLSDPEIRREVETMKALLQDIIHQDQALVKDLKVVMDSISEKMKEISDAKRLNSGYLSFNYPGAGFLDCSI